MKMPTTATAATLALASLGKASQLETILFVLTAVLSPKEAKAHTDIVVPAGICETKLHLCKWSYSKTSVLLKRN